MVACTCLILVVFICLTSKPSQHHRGTFKPDWPDQKNAKSTENQNNAKSKECEMEKARWKRMENQKNARSKEYEIDRKNAYDFRDQYIKIGWFGQVRFKSSTVMLGWFTCEYNLHRKIALRWTRAYFRKNVDVDNDTGLWFDAGRNLWFRALWLAAGPKIWVGPKSLNGLDIRFFVVFPNFSLQIHVCNNFLKYIEWYILEKITDNYTNFIDLTSEKTVYWTQLSRNKIAFNDEVFVKDLMTLVNATKS